MGILFEFPNTHNLTDIKVIRHNYVSQVTESGLLTNYASCWSIRLNLMTGNGQVVNGPCINHQSKWSYLATVGRIMYNQGLVIMFCLENL